MSVFVKEQERSLRDPNRFGLAGADTAARGRACLRRDQHRNAYGMAVSRIKRAGEPDPAAAARETMSPIIRVKEYWEPSGTAATGTSRSPGGRGHGRMEIVAPGYSISGTARGQSRLFAKARPEPDLR